MGEGRMPRQVGVLKEVVCAAEAPIRVLCMGNWRQSSLIDEPCDRLGWAIQIPLGPFPAADNRIRLQIVCTRRANNCPTRYLTRFLSSSTRARTAKGLGERWEKMYMVHTGYAWFYVKREREAAVFLDALAAQRLEKDWTEFLWRRAFFNFYLLDIICSRARLNTPFSTFTVFLGSALTAVYPISCAERDFRIPQRSDEVRLLVVWTDLSQAVVWW